MIYRVKLNCGYREFCFDFTNPDMATEFMLSAVTAYNKEASDEIKVTLEAYTMDEYNKMNKKEEEKETE